MKNDRDPGTNRGGYGWHIEVIAGAHLDYWINDYFSGLTLRHNGDGTTVLTGELTDLPAVYGLILQLRDSGIALISLQVKRIIEKGDLRA